MWSSCMPRPPANGPCYSQKNVRQSALRNWGLLKSWARNQEIFDSLTTLASPHVSSVSSTRFMCFEFRSQMHLKPSRAKIYNFIIVHVHAWSSCTTCSRVRHECRFVLERRLLLHMGWLWSVGLIKLHVSFAEYRLFYRALLQKRPIINRSY